MKSQRQIEQLLYLNKSSDLPFASCLVATDSQINLLSSDHFSFLAFLIFSVLFDSTLAEERMLSFKLSFLVSLLKKDSLTWFSKSSAKSSELIFDANYSSLY
jgi:hypothetical protein